MTLADTNALPFYHVTFQAGGSGVVNENIPVLIGQKLTAGTATAETLIPVAKDQEDTLFGKGSMLAYMVKKFRKNNPTTTPYAISLADPTGVKASATITVETATATVDETLQFDIFGEGRLGNVVNVTVLTGDTDAEVATAIASAINADTSLMVTASATAEVVTVTARHFGTLFNTLTIKTIDEPTIDLTITAFASGTGAIDLTGVLDVIPTNGTSYNIGTAYNDNTNLAIIKDYYNNTDGAWSDIKQSFGHSITVKQLSLANAVTDSANHNDEHLTIVNTKVSATPLFGVTGALLGWHDRNLTNRSTLSLPEQQDVLEGIVLDEAFSIEDQIELGKKNIGLLTKGRTGDTKIVRLFTTYKLNAYDEPDTTYRDIQTMAQLQFLVKYLRNVFQTKFGKSILNNQVVKDIYDAMVLAIIDLSTNDTDGIIVENKDAMIEALSVTRSNIAGRVNVSFSSDMVDALRQVDNTIITYDNIL